MAQKEVELRDACKDGKIDIVNALLEEGVAQTPDEVKILYYIFQFLRLTVTP